MTRASPSVRAGTLLVVLLVVTATLPGTATASVSGRPDVDVSLPENRVAPGEEATLEFVLANAADIDQLSTSNAALTAEVTTADGVAVSVERGNAPLSIETNTRLLGSLVDGGSATAAFDVTVDEDAETGTYDLAVTVAYSHARTVSEALGVVTEREVTKEYDVEVRIAPDDEVRFRVVETSARVRAGESGPLAVTVEHVGERPARDVTVQLRSLDPAVGPAGGTAASRYAGQWVPGERRTLTYRVAAARGATATPHALEVVATYANAAGTERTGDPLAIGVVPRAGERFRVTGRATQLGVGERGPLRVAVTNDGPGATDAVRVHLAATSPALRVDGGTTSEAAVGHVPAGATGVAAFSVAATDAATGGNYTLAATVTYEDAAGATATIRTYPVTVAVAPEPALSVAAVDSSLFVGERGTVTGTVVNEGQRPIHNAVLRVTEAPDGVQFSGTSYPLGDLGTGERASFSLPATVPPGVTAGPRATTFVVEYERSDGTVARSDPLRTSATVAPERDTFAVQPVNATFAPDTSDRLVVRIRNDGDRSRTDVRARLRPALPFTSVAPSAYVGRLEPGETATVAFELSTDEDAVAARHALALNVTADDGDGRTETETQLVPVRVATDDQPVGDLAPFAVLGVLTVAVLAAGGWWWVRRR